MKDPRKKKRKKGKDFGELRSMYARTSRRLEVRSRERGGPDESVRKRNLLKLEVEQKRSVSVGSSTYTFHQKGTHGNTRSDNKTDLDRRPNNLTNISNSLTPFPLVLLTLLDPEVLESNGVRSLSPAHIHSTSLRNRLPSQFRSLRAWLSSIPSQNTSITHINSQQTQHLYLYST